MKGRSTGGSSQDRRRQRRAVERLIAAAVTEYQVQHDELTADLRDAFAQLAEDAGVALDARAARSFAASGSISLPLSDRDTAWDAAAAAKSLSDAQLSKAFFWRDPDGDAKTKSAYKLGFASADGGTLTAIWKGVTAAAGALQGARGGVQIPAADVPGVKAKIGAYYKAAAEKYDDPSIKLPWEADDKKGEAAITLLALAEVSDKSGLDIVYEDGAVAMVGGSGASMDEFLARVAYWQAEFAADMGPCADCGHSLDMHDVGDDGDDDGGCMADGCMCSGYAEASAEAAVSSERAALAAMRDTLQHGVKCSCGHALSEHIGADGPCKHEDGRGTCSCGSFAEMQTDESAQLRQELAAVPQAEIEALLAARGYTVVPAAGTLTAEDGAVAWGTDDGFIDVLAKVTDQLLSPYRAIDVSLDLERALVAGADEVWSVPLADGKVGDDWGRVEFSGDDQRPATVMRMTLRDLEFADAAEAVLPPDHKPGQRLPKRGPQVQVPEPPTRASTKDGIPWTATLCPEATLTDDGRCFAPGSMDWRDLPLSLMAMIETQEGHDGAQLSGRIDQIWRDGNMIKGAGVFDPGDYGMEIARLVDDETLRGVSVDIAVHAYEVGPRSQWFDADGNWNPQPDTEEAAPSLTDLLFGDAPDEPMISVITSGTIGAATVCPFQAFREATIEVASSLAASAQSPAVWTYTGVADFKFAAADGEVIPKQEVREKLGYLTASAAGLAPVKPPVDWFEDPEFDCPTALTVNEDGRVFGHAALWDVCHIGIPGVCTTAPASATDYAYFLLKEVECDGGERIACGTITIDAPHADRRLGRADATAHYDHTGTACADVTVGEDEYGIWVSGALRPDVDETLARDLRGAALSGDWRNMNGNLELVALLAVNVPGFPVPRAPLADVVVASGESEVQTLVAAGIDLKLLLGADDRERFEQLQARAAAPDFARLRDRAQA